MENLWEVGALPRTPLRGAQRSPNPGGEGELLLPAQEPPLSAFNPLVLPPMKTPWYALGGSPEIKLPDIPNSHLYGGHALRQIYTAVSLKNAPFYFLNNSVKRQPI